MILIESQKESGQKLMPSQWSQEKFVAALKYAAAAHLGQEVPGSNLPYVVHVSMVAMEVIRVLQVEDGIDGDLAVQCALLHDVIEDAGKSYEDLEKAFGKKVADGVLALTKSNMIKPKPEKMADSLARIKAQPREIGMVKLADRIVNLQPPPAHWSAEKRSRYREEASQIYENLKASSVFLAGRLAAKISDYKAYIYD
jgi:(p)ppGpp synthase/HD superfamily hydrolase